MTAAEFTVLVQKHQGLVYTVCRQLTGDDHIAQDLTQETFLSAWKSIDRCPPGAQPQWLARIAANKAKDYLKSAWHRRVNAPGDEILALSGAPPESQPERQLSERAGAEELRELILALREPYRQVCILFFLEELPQPEIAARLGRPLRTVSSQIARARQMLQKQIKERSAGNNGTGTV